MRTWTVIVALLVLPARAQATEWHVFAGIQSADKGRQILAFLPNELWVHVGDSITWQFLTDEIHTVTFLTPGQIRPTYVVGCPGPGTTPDGSSFSGACVNSGTLVTGQSYTVSFPVAGNYRLVCLVHANMTGTIHVLNPSELLPHDQAYYDSQAEKEASQLLADGARLQARGVAAAVRDAVDDDTHHHESGGGA